MTGNSSSSDERSLSRSELKRRATSGVFVITSRGFVIMLLGLAGNIVVARLLSPSDFGLVAVGMSIVLFSGLLSDGGLGAGLIRRAEPPSRTELGALSAFQLAVTGAITLVAVAVAVPLGRVGWITAVMVASMPLTALQFPGRILLERSLLYRRLAVVELGQALSFQAWAVATVAAGFGVWGLATATVVRGLVGAVMTGLACPEGRVRPRPSMRLIKPLVGFGLRFQAVNAVWIVGEQSLNLSVGAIGGSSALGLWVLARRVMEVPYLLIASLWRVSFPTMSKLVAAKENVGPLVERAVGVAAVGIGLGLTGIAGGAPGLVPGLFGSQWEAATAILPGACLAVAVSGSVAVATQGYLYAVGDTTTVLRAEVVQVTLWFAVALPLLPVMGVGSVGVGWCISSTAQAAVLGRAAARRTGARVFRPLLAPLAVGVGAASAGWGVTVQAGSDLPAGIAGGGGAMLLFLTALALVRRRLLRETYRLVGDAVRGAGSSRRLQESGK